MGSKIRLWCFFLREAFYINNGIKKRGNALLRDPINAYSLIAKTQNPYYPVCYTISYVTWPDAHINDH